MTDTPLTKEQLSERRKLARRMLKFTLPARYERLWPYPTNNQISPCLMCGYGTGKSDLNNKRTVCKYCFIEAIRVMDLDPREYGEIALLELVCNSVAPNIPAWYRLSGCLERSLAARGADRLTGKS